MRKCEKKVQDTMIDNMSTCNFCDNSKDCDLSKRFWGHLKTVHTHRKFVRKAMRDCGESGFWHDLSKYNPIEFFESVRYYTGTKSPIETAKEMQGYSMAWLHHKGRNPHHSQYWLDCSWGEVIPYEIPWKYLLEFICDGIGAGKAYAKNKGEVWDGSVPLNYWLTKDSKSFYHPETRKKIMWYYCMIDKYGWKEVSRLIKQMGDIYTLPAFKKQNMSDKEAEWYAEERKYQLHIDDSNYDCAHCMKDGWYPKYDYCAECGRWMASEEMSKEDIDKVRSKEKGDKKDE